MACDCGFLSAVSGASRVVFEVLFGARALRNPAGHHAHIGFGGAVVISLAIRRRFKAATTY